MFRVCVHMLVCVYVCICVWVYVFVYVRLCVWMCMLVCVYVWVFGWAYMCLCVWVLSMFVCMSVHVCVIMYVCVYVPVRVHVHTLRHKACGDQRTSCRTIVSFDHVGPRNWTQAFRLGGRYLYPLSHLTTHCWHFLVRSLLVIFTSWLLAVL